MDARTASRASTLRKHGNASHQGSLPRHSVCKRDQGRPSLELVLPFEDVEHFDNAIIPARDPLRLVLAE